MKKDEGNRDNYFAQLLDRATAQEQYVDRARSLLEGEFSKTGSPRRRVSKTATVGLVAAMAAAAVLFLLLSPRELSVSLEGVKGNLEAGTWVSTAITPRQLIFSDGSTIDAGQNTELRVLSLRSNGADVLLESGELEADIVHAEKTRWSFRAGPYHVKVIGTAFRAAWQPDEKSFRLQMKEGTVQISGPLLDKGKTLFAGNEIEVFLLSNAVAIHRNDITETIRSNRIGKDLPGVSVMPVDEETASADVTPEKHTGGSDTGKPSLARHPVESPQTSQNEPEDWRRAARTGDYPGAMAIVDRIGFNNVVSSASADDLMILADAARLAGNHPRAEQAYTLVRSRFPLTEQAQRSAFAVGRMYFNRGAHGRAADWFRLCINDNRSGTMTREAAGRLIEALDNAGDHAGALGAATKYLQVFPDGPHARLARQILATGKSE